MVVVVSMCVGVGLLLTWHGWHSLLWVHTAALVAAIGWMDGWCWGEWGEVERAPWQGNRVFGVSLCVNLLDGVCLSCLQVPIGVAIGSVGLCAGVNKLLQRFAKTPAVPGLVAPATHPHLYPAAAAPGELEFNAAKI